MPLKLAFSKQVFDQLPPEDQATLRPITCHCTERDPAAQPDPECDGCDGGGVVWEQDLSQEESDAIENNLRSQGVPLGKMGTH